MRIEVIKEEITARQQYLFSYHHLDYLSENAPLGLISNRILRTREIHLRGVTVSSLNCYKCHGTIRVIPFPGGGIAIVPSNVAYLGVGVFYVYELSWLVKLFLLMRVRVNAAFDFLFSLPFSKSSHGDVNEFLFSWDKSGILSSTGSSFSPLFAYLGIRYLIINVVEEFYR